MAQNRNYSSSFEDIISKSDLVHPGPPAVYQLKKKKQKIGSLIRLTIGEKQETKANKTILLVGETGTGKSTLVNVMVNYAVGVIFEDEIWLKILKEKKERNQTSDVIVYQIYGFEGQNLPFSLTIIDTPGYGDTQDADHNIRTNHRLMELFQSDYGIQEVHAVVLVMKDGENPVTDRLKYIYDFIKSQFGKDVEKNIVALTTNSHGNPPKNVLQALEAANIKCAKNEKNQPVHFQFDNRQDEERTEDKEIPLENAWRLSERGMEEFTAFLENSPPLHLKVMMEAHKEQIRLTACIQNLQERVRFTELKIRDVEQTQEALCNNKQMKSDQTFNVIETYKREEPLTDGICGYETSLCCLVCEENCHYPGCTEALNPQQCEVMIGGKCTSCTNKCPASDHVVKKCRFLIRTQKVQKSEETLEQYKQEAGEKAKPSERLETEKITLITQRNQLINEAYGLFIQLHKLDKVDDWTDEPGSTFVMLAFLIKKMKRQADEEKLQELEEIYNLLDQGTRSSQKYRMAMTSSNQETLISESVQIHQGLPAIYQLIPKKETIGTLTRLTVGEKDEMKINKTILLVGETGTGKSALINALFNYTVGVKFEDQVWFQIVEERSNQTESQTSDVSVYQIFGFEGQTLPFSLTIIDTPGFRSTRGIEKDDSVSRRLFDLFRSEDGVHEINAVGLVMKASENRLNGRLKYIFNAVMSLFGNDLERNIVALITHSDGRRPENVLKALEAAKIKCSKDEMNQPVHFLFNNQQQKQRYTTEKDKPVSKYSWDLTNEEMGHLRDFLGKTKSQPLVTTVEGLNERIRLEACIQNLKERIKENELNQNEIKQIKEAFNKHEAEMKKNKNFTIEVDEPYKEKEQIRGGMWGLVFYEGAVTCNTCEETCHYPGCTMAWKPAYCEVIKNGSCTVCTNKCPASDHVKENWIYVTKTRKVQKTLNDVKKKYDQNKAECEKKSTFLENLEKETIKLTTERSKLLDQVYSHVIILEKITMNVNSGSTLVHLDFMIEKMKEKGDQEKVHVLKKMKIRMEKETEPKTQWKIKF